MRAGDGLRRSHALGAAAQTWSSIPRLIVCASVECVSPHSSGLALERVARAVVFYVCVWHRNLCPAGAGESLMECDFYGPALTIWDSIILSSWHVRRERHGLAVVRKAVLHARLRRLAEQLGRDVLELAGGARVLR